MLEAAIGRFGPYVKHGSVYANIAEVEEVFTIGMNRAVEVLAQKAARGPGRGAAAEPLALLGDPHDGGPVQAMPGMFGPCRLDHSAAAGQLMRVELGKREYY